MSPRTATIYHLKTLIFTHRWLTSHLHLYQAHLKKQLYIYSPSPQYHDDDSKTVTPHPRHAAHPPPSLTANPASQPHQHTTAPALHRHAKSNTDGTSQSSKPILSDTSKKPGKRTIQLGSNPTLLKKQRQSTSPGAPTPKPKMPVEAVFQQPAQRSQWFQQDFTGVHTESGILRWFGSLKNVSEKQKNRMPRLHQRGTANIPRDHP